MSGSIGRGGSTRSHVFVVSMLATPSYCHPSHSRDLILCYPLRTKPAGVGAADPVGSASTTKRIIC